MQIGFLVDRIAFGGGERILKMLIDEFCKQGHAISIYSWNRDWLIFDNVHNYNIHVLCNPPVGFKGKIQAYKELRREFASTQPDCLIIFSLGLAEVGIWAARVTRIPTILSERVDPLYLPHSKMHRYLKLLVYSKCNGIVFQTEEVKNFFSKSIQEKGVVIQNPIMDDKLAVADIDNFKKEIVAVGRLSMEKNFGLLINAFARLNLPEYKLRIFGEGPLLNDLSQMITFLGMDGRIVLEGKVDRVVDYIQYSDIFVMSSNHEGMPNALIESMAMGLACISTDFSSGGAKALIANRENGILIPVNDILAMQKAILELVNNMKLKRKLKVNALKVRETNSKEKILPAWIDFICTISQNRK